MIYDIVVDNRHDMGSLFQRLERIERDISELKQYRAKLTGICVSISTLIGLIPTLFKWLN